jgi:hypothetical protein
LPCVVEFQSSGWYLRVSGRPIKLAAMLTTQFRTCGMICERHAYWVACETRETDVM